MIYKNFRVNVASRVLLLGLLLLGLVIILTDTEWRVVPVLCLLFIGLLMINLIHYVEQTNRDFSQFLENIYYRDFTASIPDQNKGRSFNRLNDTYKLITHSLRELKHQKEEYLRLLEAVVDHLNVAVLCVRGDGTITLMNAAARRLLATPHLHRIDTLTRVDAYLADCLGKLVDGEQQLVTATIKRKPLNLSIHSSRFTILDQHYQLISLQNIRSELEQKEVEAWQKLTRVLSHEIMNSATPIIALIGAIKDTLPRAATLGEEEHEDLRRSIDSIESRSRGLVEFVEAYRGLTHIPAPKVVNADLYALALQVEQLMRPAVEADGIVLQVAATSKEMQARFDPVLIEQVLINLIKNAADALTGRSEPRILISLQRDSNNGAVVLDVEDNGPGIDEENMAHIFMPFYTTKSQGSGLGLAVSRQIMFMSRGFLSVESGKEQGTRFRLEFPI